MKRFPMTLARNALLTIVLTVSAFSSAPAIAAGDPNDPFDVEYRMPEGSPFTGLVIDTRERRNYVEKTAREVEAYVDLAKFPPDKYRYVANYWHMDRFYIAAMPIQMQIKEVIYQVVYFAPQDVMHHLQGRFDHPATPMMLFRQARDVDPNFKPIAIDSTTISLEAIGTYDHPAQFGVSEGLNGSLAASNRMLSTETKTRMLVYDLKQETRQHVLSFTGDRANHFWDFAFAAFHDPQMSDVYHFIKHNCTVVWFAVLDRFMSMNPKSFYNRTLRVLPFSLQQLFLDASKISLAIPRLIKVHLERRGVITYANEKPNLDVEIRLARGDAPEPEAWNTCTMMLKSAVSGFVKNGAAKIKAITGRVFR